MCGPKSPYENGEQAVIDRIMGFTNKVLNPYPPASSEFFEFENGKKEASVKLTCSSLNTEMK